MTPCGWQHTEIQLLLHHIGPVQVFTIKFVHKKQVFLKYCLPLPGNQWWDIIGFVPVVGTCVKTLTTFIYFLCITSSLMLQIFWDTCMLQVMVASPTSATLSAQLFLWTQHVQDSRTNKIQLHCQVATLLQMESLMVPSKPDTRISEESMPVWASNLFLTVWCKVSEYARKCIL